MDVTTMEAGRALDALVAEQVMGLQAAQIATDQGWKRWNSPDDWYQGDEGTIKEIREQEGRGGYSDYVLLNYSTDIAAAWQVVEALRGRWQSEDPNEPFYWAFEDCGAEGWRVDINWDHHDGPIPCYSASAATFPLSVCRAALLAVQAAKEAQDVK